MNRIQAKICSKLTPEEVKELMPDFNTECYEIMKAFGEGARVAFMGNTNDTFSFQSISTGYKILHETHVVNEREVPMPLQIKPKRHEGYWVISANNVSCYEWWDMVSDNRLFELGNCFAAEEDAQANFNAIWKIEE